MSVATSDVRNQVQDHPRNVGVQPESPRVAGTGDGVTTIFYLPVGVRQYYGGLALFNNGVGVLASLYSVTAQGQITFNSAPANNAVLSATYQTCIWTDAELSAILLRNQGKFSDDQSVLKGCQYDLIDQLLMNTDLLADLREDTWQKNPQAVIQAMVALKKALYQDLQGGPRPGAQIPFLQTGSVCVPPYTPQR